MGSPAATPAATPAEEHDESVPTDAGRLQMLAASMRELLVYQAALKAEFQKLGLDPDAEKFSLFLDRLCDPEEGLVFAEQTLALMQGRVCTQAERLRRVLAENPQGLSNTEIKALTGLTTNQVSSTLFGLKQQSEVRKNESGWVLAEASSSPQECPE